MCRLFDLAAATPPPRLLWAVTQVPQPEPCVDSVYTLTECTSALWSSITGRGNLTREVKGVGIGHVYQLSVKFEMTRHRHTSANKVAYNRHFVAILDDRGQCLMVQVVSHQGYFPSCWAPLHAVRLTIGPSNCQM